MAYDAGRCDALVDPLDSCGNWLFPHHDPRNVGGVRLAAAPEPDIQIQAVERSAVRRQGTRYRRPLSIPAEPSPCPQHRWEKPESGTGSRVAGLPYDAWRTGTSQLRAAWYDHLVCCSRCCLGVYHWQMPQAPPSGRVLEVSQRD